MTEEKKKQRRQIEDWLRKYASQAEMEKIEQLMKGEKR